MIRGFHRNFFVDDSGGVFEGFYGSRPDATPAAAQSLPGKKGADALLLTLAALHCQHRLSLVGWDFAELQFTPERMASDLAEFIAMIEPLGPELRKYGVFEGREVSRQAIASPDWSLDTGDAIFVVDNEVEKARFDRAGIPSVIHDADLLEFPLFTVFATSSPEIPEEIEDREEGKLLYVIWVSPSILLADTDDPDEHLLRFMARGVLEDVRALEREHDCRHREEASGGETKDGEVTAAAADAIPPLPDRRADSGPSGDR